MLSVLHLTSLIYYHFYQEKSVKQSNRKRPEISDEIRIKWEREQENLKRKLVTKSEECLMIKNGLHYVGGVDISFVKGDDVNACVTLVVLDFNTLQVVYEDTKMIRLTAPYMPGFLAFREAPFLVESVDQLRKIKPDLVPQVVLVDGNGVLHPKGFGLASHFGVLCNIPTVGVAKKLFQVDGLEKDTTHQQKIQRLQMGGDHFPLIGNTGKILGVALRRCDSSVNPVYVSIGHKISLDIAIWVVQQCCKYRVPEPIRQADIRSREYLRQNFDPR